MPTRQTHPDTVTLMLHSICDQPWPLRLSRDCLQFIGRYPRIDGFSVDAMALFRGIDRLA